MTKNQNKYFFYGHTRNSQDPLDPRLKISSLVNINTELKLPYRYNGLIFHVKDIDKMYVFLNDLNNPVDLSSYISGNIVFGFNDTDENYSDLLINLNNTNPSLGSLVTVYPLGVTFIFDGIKWNYFSGEYKVSNDVILSSIPTSLRKLNALIIIGNDKFLFDATLNKSTPIIIVEAGEELPNNAIDNRFYNQYDVIFFRYAGNWIRLGDKVWVGGQQLVVGDNIIYHGLNSNLVEGKLSYQELEIFETKFIDVDLIALDNNRSNLVSKLELPNYATLVLTAKY